jgi:hypothetical protein
MAQYLVAIHLPDNFDPSAATEAMEHDIDVLNEEMVAAGVRIFVGGLSAASNAKSLRAQPDGKVLVTDGPTSPANLGCPRQCRVATRTASAGAGHATE